MKVHGYNTLTVIFVGFFCYVSAIAQTLKIETLAPEGSESKTAMKTAST